ncbi:MAG: glycosyltransferase [Bacteroidetes bacterium]|nr:glycosyltransferase [Bacteroidota bacterium]MCC6655317.1 glycosyltransferase [Flavobacteriales bacterium]
MSTKEQRGPKAVLVITYWSSADALVRTYTLPYVRMMLRAMPPGSRVYLVTLEKPGPTCQRIEEDGIIHLPFTYHALGLAGAAMIAGLTWRLTRLVRRYRIDTVHAWCTPAGMVGYIVSVLTGRPLVIDSFEPHAEAMVENGTWRRSGMAHRLLFLFERLQARRARVLIAATDGMRAYAARSYGPTTARWYTKPACVDVLRFAEQEVKRPDKLRELGLEGRIVGLYAGKLGGIYLDQEVFDLFRAARDHWGENFRVLLLTPHPVSELEPMMARAGLDRSIFTVRSVPHEEVPGLMGLADFAVTPVKPVPSKRYCTPVKDGEYWALGLPVIITRDISDDSGIIREHGIGSVLESLDRPGYEKAVKEVAALLDGASRKELYQRIRQIALRYRSSDRAERIYQEIYGE